MNGTHWKEQDFIDHLYGLSGDVGHLDACAGCRDEWNRIRARKAEVAREPTVSYELLAEQRRNIYRRLDREPALPLQRIVPAFAAALVLIVGLVVSQPWAHTKAPAPTAVSDAQLFSEIYALEQSSEPHVAKPMRALFQEN